MSALLVNRGRSSSRRHNKGAPAKVVPLRDLFAAVGGLKKNPLVANRGKSRGRRRNNPLVANRGKGRRRNAGSMSGAARRKMSLLAQIRPRDSHGHFLPLRANRGKGRKRGHRRHHNPLVANRGRRGRRHHNPLVANRGRHGRRHNPLVANRGRRGMRRHNPAYGFHYRNNPFDGILGPIARAVSGIPVIGPALGAGVLALGGALTGAISIVPVHYALKAGGKYIPEKLKPFAFTIAGALLSGIVRVALRSMPYANEVSIAMAAGGGSVDAFRKLTGTSNTLAGDYGDDGWGDEGGYGEGDYGEGDYGEGDYGDDGFGDDPNVRPAEWADASLMDAQYSGEDLSAEEMHFAELGRRAFRKRFLKRRRRMGRGRQGEMTEDDMLDLESDDGAAEEYGDGEYGAPPPPSKHAGRPGRRWAWLIYWIGPAAFARLSKLDPAKRRQVIHAARHAAMKTAQKALTTGVTDGKTSMESMEAAGLLAAA